MAISNKHSTTRHSRFPTPLPVIPVRLPLTPSILLIACVLGHDAALAHSTVADGNAPIGLMAQSVAAGAFLLCCATAAFAAWQRRTAFACMLFAATAATVVTLRWVLDPLVTGGLFLSACMYAAGIARLWREAGAGAGISIRQAMLYCAGMVLLVLALLSPIDTLGDVLFSMHMVQHELLMLAVAPLLVAGRPLAAFIWAFPVRARKQIGRLVRSPFLAMPWHGMTQPLVAWSLHAAVLWAWHAPSLFEASLASEAVHTLQHLSFLASALLFWASLLGPGTLRGGEAVLYLLASTIHTGMLGALLTFSPQPWYSIYAGRTDAFGLTLLEDQQLGGLIMWVPAGFVFIIAGLAFAARLIAPRPQAGQSR